MSQGQTLVHVRHGLVGAGRAARLAPARNGRWYRRAVPREDVPRYGPPDALLTPRYAGVKTFARCPLVESPEDVDVAVLGIPFDTATTNRPGARFGPEAIRSASIALRPYNPAQEAQVFGHLSVADLGDVDGDARQRPENGLPDSRASRADRSVRCQNPLPGRRPSRRARRAARARGGARAARPRSPRRTCGRVGRLRRRALLPRLALPQGAGGGLARSGALAPRRHARLRLRTGARRDARPTSASRSSPATSW